MGNTLHSAPPVVASKLPMRNVGVVETPSAEQGAAAAYGHPSMDAFSAPIVFMGVSDEQGPRPYMEDRHTLIKNFDLGTGAQPVSRSFIAVYDGHSSSRGAAHAARRLHEIIAQQQAVRVARGGKEEQPAVEQALKAAFEDADEEIIGEAQQRGRRYGSTAVCALLVEGTLYVAHCGDSRAVLYRDGAAVQLARDHKPASVKQERQRIEAAGGVVDESTDYVSSADGESLLNMSRALGDADHKFPHKLVEAEPDVTCFRLRPQGDAFLVLGSDGIFDVLSAAEVARIVRYVVEHNKASDETASLAADAVIQEATKRGTMDNATVALMLFGWHGKP